MYIGTGPRGEMLSTNVALPGEATPSLTSLSFFHRMFSGLLYESCSQGRDPCVIPPGVMTLLEFSDIIE